MTGAGHAADGAMVRDEHRDDPRWCVDRRPVSRGISGGTGGGAASRTAECALPPTQPDHSYRSAPRNQCDRPTSPKEMKLHARNRAEGLAWFAPCYMLHVRSDKETSCTEAARLPDAATLQASRSDPAPLDEGVPGNGDGPKIRSIGSFEGNKGVI